MEQVVEKEERTDVKPLAGSKKKLDEKIVFIMRKLSFMQENNNDPEVQDYFKMSYRAVGSYYKEFGRIYGSGLTREEEVVLMPEITGYYPGMDKREYRNATQNFYKNINTKIPGEGYRMNIALTYEGDIAEDNLPQNLTHYIAWKHALGHPEVAPNKEEADKYQHKLFYIEDHDEVSKIETSINKVEDDARTEYYQIIQDTDRVEQMLVVLGKNPKGLTAEQMKVELKKFATINNAFSSKVNEDNLTRFIELSGDKYLSKKYIIEEMIRIGVLERIGMRIIIKETADEVGRDMKEAVLWFNDEGNSKEVNVLQARYKEFNKK